MSQYEEMSLARLKCELSKRDARETERKWELFQQAYKVLKSYMSHDGICLTGMMLEHYFSIACNV